MCGLAGLYLPHSSPLLRADMASMLSAMHHRGPDGTVTWSSPDGRYSCGFNRLAIIDLATGNQPLIEDAGRRVLMGNGEIYNFHELRQRPECRDYPYRSSGDMEVVLPLASAHGDDFVQYLNGMFGIALYESVSHRLVLVRDRLGIKPVYWARLPGGGILFASEIKALFASGLVFPEIDEAAVSAYLSHGWVPAPGTLWRGVNKLPPGHCLIADCNGSIKLERYWSPQQEQVAELPTDQMELRDYFTGLLEDAVALQLRSDVPLGALLSGGIDSGLLVAMAARRLDRPLNTYTVRFEGAPVDESPLAAMVAKRYGTRHTCFDLATGDVAGYFPKLAWICDEPLADASLLPNLLIEELLGREVRVALNGTGGDELFAGYGRYFQLPVEQHYLRLPAWLRRRAIEPAVRLFDPATAWRLARSEKFAGDPGGYLHDHSTLFPPPIRSLIGNRQTPPSAVQAAHFNTFRGDQQAGMLYADQMTYLPEDLLLLLDRTSMAASVEGRVPFLDHRLVEAALALPRAIRTPGNRQKGFERAMAEPYLPAEVLNAPKQGFASPVPAWLAGGLAAPVSLLLTSKTALARGWWSAQGIERLFADPYRHAHRIYALAILELNVRAHTEGRRGRDFSAQTLDAIAHD